MSQTLENNVPLVVGIPENMILELLKGRTVTLIEADGLQLELRPQTEGVFIPRDEYLKMQSEMSSSRAMMRILENRPHE